MKKTIAGALSVIVIGSVVAGIVLMNRAQDNTVESKIFTSRAGTFKDLQQMDQYAQFIIRGTVVGSGTVKEIRDPFTDVSNPAILHTDYDVLVKKVWKGDVALEGKKIIVRQVGGKKGNLTAVSADEKFLVDGEEVILFLELSRLREQLPENDGWVILGVGAGHVTIRDGRVTFGVVDPFAESYQGQPKEKFESALDAVYSKGR